jgi:tripartite-type tricarboxylate transporter receptor subunit TctC
MRQRISAVACAALVVTAGISHFAHAAQTAPAPADYPHKTIRFITGFLPGGVSDTIARVLGEKLGERLGQRVIVDGRPGAGGLISMELTAGANPDGYTLFLGTPVVTISPSFKRKLPFEPAKALAAVTLIGTSPTILVAAANLPAASVKDLIALAKSRPGGLSYASSGQGTTNHLAAELLRVTAKIPLTHIPYKGAAATLFAVITGEVDISFVPLLPAIPHVKTGKLAGIAVTGARRAQALPNVPAIAETLPGYDVTSWYGLLVPGGTPPSLIQKLNAETNHILGMADVRERLSAQGVEVQGSTPGALTELMRVDAARWATLVKDAGIVLE